MPSYSRQVPVPGKSAQELYDKVSTEIERFMEKLPIGKIDVQCDPAGRIVTAKASMVTAKLTCLEGALQVDAQLGLMALPFRSKIDSGIDQWIAKTFG